MRRRRTEHDRLLRAERRTDRGGAAGLKKRLGWPMCIVGVALFVAGYVGSAAGLQILAFDRHHLVSQLGGGFIALVGLGWATR